MESDDFVEGIAEVVDLQLDRGFRVEFALGNTGVIRMVGSKPKARFYWGFCKGRVRLMTFVLSIDFSVTDSSRKFLQALSPPPHIGLENRPQCTDTGVPILPYPFRVVCRE